MTTTPKEHLARYLNDHLAGSVLAVELLGYLIDSKVPHPREATLQSLRSEITDDQQVVRDMIARIGASESAPRKAAAWLAEKFARLKFRLEGSVEEPLELLEALEMLALGIDGKWALWQAVSSVPAFAGIGFERLSARAREQRATVEGERVAAAGRAFAAA